jgi:hypothetical protein
MARNCTPIQLTAAEKLAQRASPYWIDGIWFEGEIGDPRLQECLHAARPFAKNGDPLGTIIKKNLIAFFHTLLFYIHFYDMGEAYFSAVAEDLGWNFEACMTILRRMVRARATFVRRRQYNFPVPPTSTDKILCELIDRYGGLSANMEEQARTPARTTYIELTRATWKEFTIGDPAKVVDSSTKPAMPPPINLDWLIKPDADVKAERQTRPGHVRDARSQSPVPSAVRAVRDRSPLRRAVNRPEQLGPGTKEGPIIKNEDTADQGSVNSAAPTVSTVAGDNPAAGHGKTSPHPKNVP